MTVEEISVKALRLIPEARANLARELLASLDAMKEAEIEKLWIDEAIRRDQELDRGGQPRSTRQMRCLPERELAGNEPFVLDP
jgi:hypothetical protein